MKSFYNKKKKNPALSVCMLIKLHVGTCRYKTEKSSLALILCTQVCVSNMCAVCQMWYTCSTHVTLPCFLSMLI